MRRSDRENIAFISNYMRHMRYVHPNADLMNLAARNGLRARDADLRAALDEQVKENEQLCERNDHFINLCNMRLGKMHEFRVRAERAEAALASANEITERLRKALETMLYGENQAFDRAEARAALLAAQGKAYKLTGQDHTLLMGALARSSEHLGTIEEGGDATSDARHLTSKPNASTPASQSPDQACGADEALPRIPGVDSQVLLAAQGSHQREQPEWLFHHKDDAATCYGRWSRHQGAAAYVRADLVLTALASHPDTALVGKLADQLSTARWLIMGHMAEAGYDLEMAREHVAPFDALLARPDVIAARKGGGE